MLQSKYVVVEVSTTTATMTLVQYLITHGFDKFAVVSDLCDHPSLKYKTSINGTTANGSSNANTATNSSSSSSSSSTSSTSSNSNGKPKVSINDIAQALSKRSSPSSEQTNGFTNTLMRSSTPSTPLTNNHSALTKILEDKTRQTLEQQKEQERQQLEIQRIILGHVASVTETEERISPEINEFDPKKEANDEDTEVKTESSDSVDFGLGTSDEQVRASMIHLLNPVLGSAFGLLQSAQIEETNSRRRSDYSPATKKHRWMTNGELEESRFGRGKNYGRVHCKATYKCALCGKPTTLNSTGSRWNLLRHVIMIHSESKPYQCFDCDFNGIKSNVISHARQSGHRCDDAFDITTDEMRAEWNAMLHACFPDYVKAKTRGWQSEENTPKEVSTTENEVEA